MKHLERGNLQASAYRAVHGGFHGRTSLAGPDGADKARSRTLFAANGKTPCAARIARNHCAKTVANSSGNGAAAAAAAAVSGRGFLKPPAPPPRPSAPQPSKPSAPGPFSAAIGDTSAREHRSSRFSDLDFLDSTGEQEQAFDNGAMPPRQSPALGPSRPVRPPSPQGAPPIGDLGSAPDWGSGARQNHLSDEPDSWSGHPQLDDPEWTARRKSGMFWRLSLRR